MQSVCLDEFGGEKYLDASTQETTLIQHMFGGHLQSQVKCTKCDKISNRYENMMDLTVEIQGDAESLEDCLNQFTGKEWLDGENMYKCEGKNVRQPSIKQQDTSKINDEKSLESTSSLTNPALTNSMENETEKESLQRKAEDLDLRMPVKVDMMPVVQGSGDVGLNVLQSMDLEKVQETDLDGPQEIDLDESPGSDSCKAVDGHVDPESFVPGNTDNVLFEQNPLNLKGFEAKTNHFLSSVGYQLMKENGPTRASDEISNNAAKTSINVATPVLHGMVEAVESNPSGPRLDPMTRIDGLLDLAIGVNGLHNSFSSFEGHDLQEDLGLLCIDSMSTEELEQSPSHPLIEKDSIVKEDMTIENGVGHFYGRKNCNQLESECENLNVKEKVKPILCPGFLDSDIQGKFSNEKTQRKSNGVNHPGSSFTVTMQKTQLNDTSSLPCSDNNCSGVLYESEKFLEGSLEPCFSTGFCNGHAQTRPPNGKAETESSIVGIPCKTQTENGQLDHCLNDNGNHSGLLHECGKSSTRGHPKTLFSRGFLDHHAGKRSLKGKTQKQSSEPLPCKDNVNHIVSCYPQSMQQIGNGVDANKKSLCENGKHTLSDLPGVSLISRGFLNKSYEKSLKNVETLRTNQNGYSVHVQTNYNGCL